MMKNCMLLKIFSFSQANYRENFVFEMEMCHIQKQTNKQTDKTTYRQPQPHQRTSINKNEKKN